MAQTADPSPTDGATRDVTGPPPGRPPDLPAPRDRRPRRALAIAAVVLILAGAAAAWLWSRPLEVDALLPPSGPLQRSLQFTARVETPARVDIGATLTGRVQRVAVREGERFGAGQPLVELESDELRAVAVQADANLAQARARLQAQRSVSGPSASATLRQAQATASAAERALARTRELAAKGFVSQASVDNALRDLEVARGQRDASRVQAQANRPDGVETASARAQVEAAAATARAAAARLAQASLRAPAAGRVLVRRVEPGQIVQPGAALLTVAIDGPTELVAPVDERFLATLATGQHARVVADAYPGRPFTATVTRIAPSVDAQRGAIEVHLRPDAGAPAFLREDMTLSVEVVTGERADARLVPLRALRPGAGDGDESTGTVLVVRDGRATPREVKLGLRTIDRVEVTAGLADGEAVLLDPTLAPGRRVSARLVDLEQALGGPRGATSRDSANPAMSAAGR